MQCYSTPVFYFPANLDDYAPWVAKHGLVAPYGKCQCECGNDTPIAKQRVPQRGIEYGQPSRFCSRQCAATWRKRVGITSGQFEKGRTTWNKGHVGYNASPATRFKTGQEPVNKLPVGTVTIRTRSREGYSRTYVKVAEPNVWRPRYIVTWELHHGPVPNGYVIHHKDRDALNDDIGNLQLMTRAAHILEHKSEFEPKRTVNARKRSR